MLRETFVFFHDSNFIFLPDLVGCHYSKHTIALMDENVKFVPKEIDSPNVLQARPIETFRVCLTQKFSREVRRRKRSSCCFVALNLR